MTDTERKAITHDIRVKAAKARIRNNLFRMDYDGVRHTMTVGQAAAGFWRHQSEFIEVVW